MKKPFLKTTWSEIKVGDVALVAWRKGRKFDVAEVEITERGDDPTLADEQLVAVFFRVDGLVYGQTFGSDETAYVQSRL